MLMVEAVRAWAAHRVSAQCVLRNVGVNVTCRQRNGCAGTAEEVSRKREPRKECWIRELGTRRFDGVQTKTVFTFVFKRTSDREHGYAQQCHKRATDQYAGLVRAAHQVAQRSGWSVQKVNFVAGTTSVNVERWNKALETVGVPKV